MAQGTGKEPATAVPVEGGWRRSLLTNPLEAEHILSRAAEGPSDTKMALVRDQLNTSLHVAQTLKG